jgi:hypothetical protein
MGEISYISAVTYIRSTSESSHHAMRPKNSTSARVGREKSQPRTVQVDRVKSVVSVLKSDEDKR